jgi:hypothetical protein
MDGPEVYTVPAVAAMLGLSTKRVYQLMRPNASGVVPMPEATPGELLAAGLDVRLLPDSARARRYVSGAGLRSYAAYRRGRGLPEIGGICGEVEI